MICSQYGPVVVGWDGSKTFVNPSRCSKRVGLAEFLELINIDEIDKRLLYLLGIPRGYVTTYKLYAEVLGTSPRHVGWLMARNPLPVILPCHRVVKSDFSLGGYTGGVEVKKKLLAYEGALCGDRPCRVVRPRMIDDVRDALFKSLGLA
ncbi:MGMT family protein [Pyrobaculum aerophilum]|uniref:Methylated-DNA--protein-cysteine methyltransferase n=2 Tax=Pyrobaculum aerophilum TaxID=13773 RepID=OGT_PYRAE|nr:MULTISPECIES: methylated-DNA--[protein]-cysteine S-methyltransferase [Pyrobaculum]O93728.2 RecName: Full=Methylated-DNA--protein-cysteine methyltransferase; AltName: Full=6-O-methylguanine-DNA methyltransferase; Short=MGMT; AltName: Full=O-6-methylguanine-DNA-alkyltransferase [Pyrobaculum aerophilum str. IM2]AAD09231.2 putative metylated-DNA--[protein]-cysteine metyltransferase ogt [Pyrobaculum aerophilum str. IM2]AAL63882.1 methylated-DNA--[protein]-cysteine S-methyltransferase (ogt) [Pyroba